MDQSKLEVGAKQDVEESAQSEENGQSCQLQACGNANDKDETIPDVAGDAAINEISEIIEKDKGQTVGVDEKEKDTETNVNSDEVSLGAAKSNTDIEKSKAESSGLDPLSYTKRNEFTSEIFKIELRNLPRNMGFSELKKKLHSLSLDPVKVKLIGRGSNYCYITFRSEEDRSTALEKLEGLTWRGKQLTAKTARPLADPLLLKRQADRQKGDGPDRKKDKKTDEDADLPVVERLNNAVTPLWKTPYEDQIKIKQAEMKELMKKFGWRIQKNNADYKQWLDDQRKKYDSLCCDLQPIKPSPILNDYRNKVEFTIGNGVDPKEKKVGFRLGSYAGGTTVAECSECIHVPEAMKKVAAAVQDYIETSKYDVYHPESQEGYYRMLTVRTCQAGDVMGVVAFHPQNLPAEEIEVEKEALKAYFETGAGANCGVTSLFFQRLIGRVTAASSETPFELLLGKEHIYEDLLGLKFRISPDAFFQVNTPAAHVLYSTIGDWCQLDSMTNVTVLDVCCGTGTIGLTLAKKVHKVIGIEMVAQAIEDAKFNSQLNGITNVEFHCGKAEDVLADLMGPLRSQEVVAIVDPPRAGLHGRVCQTLRKSPCIDRLVYVSCSPKSVIDSNFMDLIRPESKKWKGTPFKPVKAVAVDLFPHTPHCELILLFERDKEKS